MLAVFNVDPGHALAAEGVRAARLSKGTDFLECRNWPSISLNDERVAHASGPTDTDPPIPIRSMPCARSQSGTKPRSPVSATLRNQCHSWSRLQEPAATIAEHVLSDSSNIVFAAHDMS